MKIFTVFFPVSSSNEFSGMNRHFFRVVNVSDSGSATTEESSKRVCSMLYLSSLSKVILPVHLCRVCSRSPGLRICEAVCDSEQGKARCTVPV